MGGRLVVIWANVLMAMLVGLAIMCLVLGCGGKGLRLAIDPHNLAPQTGQYGQFTAEELGSGLRLVQMQPQQPADPPFGGSAGKLSSALDLLLPPKTSSFTTADLLKDGSAFETLDLPLNRVAAVDVSGLYSPVSPAGAHPVLEDLAYATYSFQLDAYDGPSTIGCTWDAGLAPAGEGGFWVGLANRDRRRWDWFSGPTDGVLTLEAMQPYLEATSGRLLMVIVVLGDQVCSLQQLEIGAQEQRSTGAIMDPSALVDNFPGFNGGKGGSDAQAVDLSPLCAPVGDQGAAASCTAFAIANGAYNFELNRLYGAYGWDFDNALNLASPKYMYLLTGQDQGFGCPDEGRITGLCLDWLLANGCATEQNAPYLNLCDEDWGQAALDDAALLKLEKVFSIDPSGTLGVSKLKTLLEVHQVPLVLRINVDPDFFWFTDYESWNFSGPVVGTQALLLVGYDDARQAFKARNSWGQGWRNSGYCWIGYDTFISHSAQAAPWCWVLYDDYDAAVAERFCSGQAAMAPPTNVQATDGTYSDRVTLTWVKSAGATGYAIYRDDPATPLTMLADVDIWDDTAMDEYCHTYWVQALGAEESVLSTPDLGFFAQAPQINSVAPLAGMAGSTVQFTAGVAGSQPMQYAWTFGGGAMPGTSDIAAPVVQLGETGAYNCTLDVTNILGTAHYDFVLDVSEALYIMPDLADPDWSVVTGSGTASSPFVLDAADMTRMYSMKANTMPDGSGGDIDVATLEWDAMPPFIVSWVAPGECYGNQITSGYVFAQSASLVSSNCLFIEIHALP